jgi:hypothetical protein
MKISGIGLVFDNQHTHAHNAKSRTHIADVWKITYVLATPRCLN